MCVRIFVLLEFYFLKKSLSLSLVLEDSRISKLLRRLCREDDYDHLMVLCKQVQESIVAHENQRYIRRNLETICESLLDFLHSGPGQEAKQQVAKCLGRIGYVVEQDFKRYVHIPICKRYIVSVYCISLFLQHMCDLNSKKKQYKTCLYFLDTWTGFLINIHWSIKMM